MDRIAISELTTLRWPLEEDVAWYHRFGFGAIGVWRDKLFDYGEEKGSELIREHGLTVSSLQWIGGFTGSDGRTHEDSIEDAHRAIEVAANLDAGCLIVHSGGHGGHTDRHAMRLLRSALESILPTAEALNVRLALEPMCSASGRTWTILRSINDCVELIDQLGSSNLGVVADTYHLRQAENLKCDLAAHLDKLYLVQIADSEFDRLEYSPASTEFDSASNDPIVMGGSTTQCHVRRKQSCEQERCLLGTGQQDVIALIDELEELGYEGLYEVELFGEALEGHSYPEIMRHTRRALADSYSGMRSRQTK